MRDDPSDKPIPERFEPHTDYDDKHIETARAVLAELPSLSAAECERRATAEHADKLDSHRRYARQKQEYRVRYEAMLAVVEAWQVPDDLWSNRDRSIG